MVLKRKTVAESLKTMPESFTIEELLDRLLLLNKIESGLADVQAGNTVPLNEARKKLKKWLK